MNSDACPNTPIDLTGSNDKSWTAVKALFESALEREGVAREQFLEEACGTNRELWREVDALLSGRAGCRENDPSGRSLLRYVYAVRQAGRPTSRQDEFLTATFYLGAVVMSKSWTAW